MTTPPPAPSTPREKASLLINSYALKKASLKDATSSTIAKITALTAALNQASAPYLLELEKIEAEATALALAHGKDIFGTKRSLIENGYKLGLAATEEVEMDAAEEIVCRILLDDLLTVERKIFAAEAAEDPVKVQELSYQRLALTSVLNIKYSINKPYVKSNAAKSAEWFEFYGIRVVKSDSASLKEATPSQAAKASKAPKLSTPEQPEQDKEAA